MAQQPVRTREPIPGYELQERVGAGGYGEVWRAIAPGGIAKAIKFIYGFHDEDRAARELKALNRIKELRHPFLLSLDRIEVVDGQLVIVTELADMSLKDRFVEAQRSGMAGIPRDELLVCLHDAADALDYMSDHCSLQHLDIKPENLLLVGGRVKVGDFGLVRDVHEVTASLMGGLTPVYAPPELFEGRPGLRSDQYSLAVVYQEMLTGTLPFSGATAAQLMSQHLYDRPYLAPLPAADHAAVARGLSKAAAHRFPSCRALIDQLREQKDAGQNWPGAPLRPARPADGLPPTDVSRGHTQAVGGGPPAVARPADLTPAGNTIDLASINVETVADVRELPPVTLATEEVVARPVLFLGIGGTAGRTLRRLRRRLTDRFGDLGAVPMLRMLLIDTDLKSILRATGGDRQAALQPDETIVMPLRRTREYLADTEKCLGWLSRRWLFNIPRSLQPEGRRPLGRVALIDHAEHVFDRIRNALEAITAPQAVAASAAAIGHPVADVTPRIFLIASISGGTGGGTVLDLAYAVRKILGNMGLGSAGLRGILMHSTSREAEARDLAIANTYACLKEFYHCAHPSLAYPGAPECGLAPTSEGDRPFPHTYLIHLGDHLSEPAFDAATDQVAHYLYLDAATPVGSLLDKCRALEPLGSEGTSPGSWLRSLGLCRLRNCREHLRDNLVDRLCRDVIGCWRGDGVPGNGRRHMEPAAADPAAHVLSGAGGAPPADPQRSAPPGARQLGLELKPMLEQVAGILEAHLGKTLDEYCHDHLERLLQPSAADDFPSAARLVAAANTVFEALDAEPARAATMACRNARSLRARLDGHAADQGRAVREWVSASTKAPDASVAMARRIGQQLATYLCGLDARVHGIRDRVHGQLQQLAQSITAPRARRTKHRWHRVGPRGGANQWAYLRDPLQEYLALKSQQQVVAGVLHIVRSLKAELARVDALLETARRELEALACQFKPPAGRQENAVQHGAAPANADQIIRRAIDQIEPRWPQLVADCTQAFKEEILHPHGGLVEALTGGQDFRGRTATMLRDAASLAVFAILQEINVTTILFADDAKPEEVRRQIHSWLETATPRLLTGGAQRLVLAVQEGTDTTPLETHIRETTDQACSTVFDRDSDVVFCCEVEQLPIGSVVAQLTSHRADYAAIASRLHTRVDVAWTSLDAG